MNDPMQFFIYDAVAAFIIVSTILVLGQLYLDWRSSKRRNSGGNV